MVKRIPLSKISPNSGQIDGLPKNPRFIRDKKFESLKKSLQDDPEMLELREVLVIPLADKYIVIGGNMRFRAAKELGFKDIPCKIINPETPVEKLRAYTVKDNGNFGEWNFDDLGNEWDIEELEDWGVDLPFMDELEEEPEKEKQAKDPTIIVSHPELHSLMTLFDELKERDFEVELR